MPGHGSAAERLVPDAVGGVGLAVGAAVISGLAIYLNGFAVKQLPDAAVFTTLKNAVAAVILIGLAVGLGSGRDVRAIGRRTWPAVIAVGVVGGSIPFILFFTGLSQASAPTAAFIQKTLFVWVALLAVPFLGERLGSASVIGLAVLFVGQALVLPPDGIRWGAGESMILVATLLWAAETLLVKRLLASIPSQTMAALRMGIGVVVLVGYLAITGRLVGIAALGASQWGWVLLSGIILSAYVATWFAALQRAPAAVVTSVLVVGAVITGALTTATRGAAPSVTATVGYLLILGAVAVVVGLWGRGRRVVAVPRRMPELT